MSFEPISRVKEMDLTPCEFTLLMQIAHSPSSEGLLFPDWDEISALTGFTIDQINRMLMGLVHDRLIRTSGVYLWPPISDWKRKFGIWIGDLPPELEPEPVRNRPVKKRRPGYIYLIHGIDTPWYKIGHSEQPQVRRAQLGTQGPFRHEMIHAFEVDDMLGAERLLHEFYARKAAEGEWFHLNSTDLAFFCGLACRTVDELRGALSGLGASYEQ
jgi:hypothetical protein